MDFTLNFDGARAYNLADIFGVRLGNKQKFPESTMHSKQVYVWESVMGNIGFLPMHVQQSPSAGNKKMVNNRDNGQQWTEQASLKILRLKIKSEKAR